MCHNMNLVTVCSVSMPHVWQHGRSGPYRTQCASPRLSSVTKRPLPVAAGSGEVAQIVPEWTRRHIRLEGFSLQHGHTHTSVQTKDTHTADRVRRKSKNTFPGFCHADKGNVNTMRSWWDYNEILHWHMGGKEEEVKLWKTVKGVAKQCESLGVCGFKGVVYFGLMSLRDSY